MSTFQSFTMGRAVVAVVALRSGKFHGMSSEDGARDRCTHADAYGFWRVKERKA